MRRTLTAILESDSVSELSAGAYHDLGQAIDQLAGNKIQIGRISQKRALTDGIDDCTRVFRATVGGIRGVRARRDPNRDRALRRCVFGIDYREHTQTTAERQLW